MTVVPSSTGTGPFPANPTHSFLSPPPSSSASTRQRWGCPPGLCSSRWDRRRRRRGSSGPVTHTRGKVSAGRKQLTPREGFTLWEVLASLCGELGAAGELGGGSGWLLVPAVCTLEVFSRTIGGLLREQEGAFHSASLFHSKAKIQPEDLKSRLTCRRHKGFPPHSWQEGGRDQ